MYAFRNEGISSAEYRVTAKLTPVIGSRAYHRPCFPESNTHKNRQLRYAVLFTSEAVCAILTLYKSDCNFFESEESEDVFV